jgi:hypothetical protein
MAPSFTFIKLTTLLVSSFVAQANFRPVAASANVAAPTYSATYLPYNAPKKSETGQTGTNQVCMFTPWRFHDQLLIKTIA